MPTILYTDAHLQQTAVNKMAQLLSSLVGPADTFEDRDEARQLMDKAFTAWCQVAERARGERA
jgi:hypothetical protein